MQTDWDKDIRNELDIELARCKGGYTDELPDKVYMGGWVLQLKLDGIRISLQFGKTRNWLVSRNREDKLKGVDKAGAFCAKEGIEPFASLIRKDLEGTMLDGELVWPGHGAPEVLSLAARSDPKNLHYVVFDCLFYKGKDLREKPYAERLVYVKRAVEDLGSPQIEAIKCLSATRKSLQELWDSGEEGGVFAELKAAYKASCSRYKAKAEVTVDGFIMAVSQAKAGGSPKNGVKPQPNGKAAMFLIGMYDEAGKAREVGWCKIIDDDVAEDGYSEFDTRYKGRVIRMTASGWDGERFRWLRWAGFHEDKTDPKACKLEEQIGVAGTEVSKS